MSTIAHTECAGGKISPAERPASKDKLIVGKEGGGDRGRVLQKIEHAQFVKATSRK